MSAMTKVFHRAPFAGQGRTFRLRLGEVGELERLCNAGIGAIAMRLATHQFYNADVRETVRLGLQGGGLDEPTATALIMSAFDDRPLSAHIELAALIIKAYLDGIPDELKKKEPDANVPAPASSPATSPDGTASAQ